MLDHDATAPLESFPGFEGYSPAASYLLLLQVLDILSSSATNPVVLSGDIHNAFVWRLTPDNATEPVRHVNRNGPELTLVAASLCGSSLSGSKQLY